jgi:DNA uptake protein ComE-like DNA-binding protein
MQGAMREERLPDPVCFAGFCVRPRTLACQSASSIWKGFSTAFLAIAILALSLAGLAQNRDQDRYRYSKTSATAPPPEARIDINRATVEELLKVPGMTRSWAGRIMRFRPYRTKLDLVDKGIITAVAYDRIKDSIIAHRVPD